MPYTIHEIVLSYMKLTGNSKQIGYPQLREAIDISWYKLFKKTKESIRKTWLVNKNGIVDYPAAAESILGVYTINDCNDLSPLLEDNIKSIDPEPELACSCNAADHDECMCSAISDTDPSTVDITIEGEPYTNKYFTRVLKNGDIVEEKHEWVASFNSAGVFVEAIEVISQQTVCALETKPCGCLATIESNIEKLCKYGCFDNSCAPYVRKRYPAFYSEFGYYKKDDVNRKIHVFDSNGEKSKLKHFEIKYQSNGTDMLIPDYAKPALIALLNWTKVLYSSSTPTDDIKAKKNFYREKNDMLRHLNPIPWESMMQGYPALPVNRRNYDYNFGGVSSTQNNNPQECVSNYNATPSVVKNINNYTTINYNTQVGIQAKVDGLPGSPVAGEFTWQHNDLKDSNILFIVVNKAIETVNVDFTIDPSSGILTRTNIWVGADGEGFEGDVLIIPN
jgi:hypothetical protein